MANSFGRDQHQARTAHTMSSLLVLNTHATTIIHHIQKKGPLVPYIFTNCALKKKTLPLKYITVTLLSCQVSWYYFLLK